MISKIVVADSFQDLGLPSGRNWVMNDVYGMAWPQILAFSSAVLGIIVVGLIVKSLGGRK
jgi:hypothetical protein